LPWKRGPAAWNIKLDVEEIKMRLAAQKRNFFSLRQAAKILGVSTQPIRDWIRLKYLKREGLRGQITKSEFERFLKWLVERAKPFSLWNYADRLLRSPTRPAYLFHTLGRAEFVWPKERKTLTPRELAGLIGCHHTLIIKAIHHKPWLAKRKSPGRWEITRHRWENTFPLSNCTQFRMPSLPRQPLFSTKEAAEHMTMWGMRQASTYTVRRMIHSDQLVAIPPAPGKRKYFVPRKNLEKMRKNLLTAQKGAISLKSG